MSEVETVKLLRESIERAACAGAKPELLYFDQRRLIIDALLAELIRLIQIQQAPPGAPASLVFAIATEYLMARMTDLLARTVPSMDFRITLAKIPKAECPQCGHSYTDAIGQCGQRLIFQGGNSGFCFCADGFHKVKP